MATVAAGRRGSARARRRQLPRSSPLAPWLARIAGSWLDRELAAGVEPWRTPLHSARSLQITSLRARRSLARSIEGLIDRAARPVRRPGFSAQVPVDGAAVLGARGYLEAIADRLRDGRPVSTAGTAALRDLMCDGTGPLYSPLSGIGLGRVLLAIQDSLDVPD